MHWLFQPFSRDNLVTRAIRVKESCLSRFGKGYLKIQGITIGEQMTAAAIDLTGVWAGHYAQRDRSHAIHADLVQTGHLLTGVMRDHDTKVENSLFESAAEAGLPPGADEQIALRLRELYPEDRHAPIRRAMSLPSTSLLMGHVQTSTVYFLKSYQGDHFSGYRIGERRIGVTIAGHSVHYRGQINDAGTEIQGEWRIDPVAQMSRRTEGAFLLRRIASKEGDGADQRIG